MKELLKPYKKTCGYSYTSGAYATIELIKTRPAAIEKVYVHPDFCRSDELTALCASHAIPVGCDEKIFARINQKENAYVLGVFKKYPSRISPECPHVVLVNPADKGNLGTVVRTLVGMGLPDLAIITPAADIWDPKTIRASMGALFHLRFEHFADIERYLYQFSRHKRYAFMLDGPLELRPGAITRPALFSLIFGNEARGLDTRYARIATGVRIAQSARVDSLNLAAAVAIGAYVFTL